MEVLLYYLSNEYELKECFNMIIICMFLHASERENKHFRENYTFPSLLNNPNNL